MKTKLIDLPATNNFTTNDLVWLRKAVDPYDHKITYEDFLKSIGNTAVKGFVAISQQQNKLTLSPSTGVILDRYYDRMVVDFVSPITSDGVVQIQIGNLAYVDLGKMNSAAAGDLVANKYYSAIYNSNTNKFYQTNITQPTLWSNEYGATAEIAQDQQSTTLTLTSAIGASKTEYYNNMSLLFTCPIATKGVLLVNVDGLGIKQLKDPDGDLIPDDLDAGEAILAIYNGAHFVKHIFSTVEPPAPPLPVDPDVPIPEVNRRSVTVGPNRSITTVETAISQFIREFGESGGNHICTINLASDLVWASLLINSNANLNWIKINNSSVTFVRDFFLGIATSSSLVFPEISGSFNLSNELVVLGVTAFMTLETGSVILSNANFSLTKVQNNHFVTVVKESARLTLSNVTMVNNATLTSGNIIKGGSFSATNCAFASIILSAENGNLLSLKNCSFTNTKGSYPSLHILGPFANAEITGCTIKSDVGIAAAARNATGNVVLFSNNRVGGKTGAASLFVGRNTEVIVDGGDYRDINGSVSVGNITADGSGAVIRLRNSPIGGTKAVNGGTIIVE